MNESGLLRLNRMNTVCFEDLRVTPSKVVCVGRNYLAHIMELSNEIPTSMVLFLKPNSAISETLKTKPGITRHYEGEISFLIRQGRICAVGFGLDLTDRTLQSALKAKGLPWERAKAFDGAAVFGKFVSVDEQDLEFLSMQLWINGVQVQNGIAEHMIHKPQAIIDEIQTFSTLRDDDIVMSGSPEGVGPFYKGDHFVGKILVRGKVLTSDDWIAE